MTFSNNTDRVLEGELIFPLSEGSFVSGYSLDIEGQLVPGVIVSKMQSRVAFETTGGSNSCGMIEQTIGNVYKTRIYPLPANGQRTTQIKFCEQLVIQRSKEKGKEKTLQYNFPCKFSSPITLELFCLRIGVDDSLVFSDNPSATSGIAQLESSLRMIQDNVPIPVVVTPVLTLQNGWSIQHPINLSSFSIPANSELLRLKMATYESLSIVSSVSTRLCSKDESISLSIAPTDSLAGEEKRGFHFSICDYVEAPSASDKHSFGKVSEDGSETIALVWDSSFSQRNTDSSKRNQYFAVLRSFFARYKFAILEVYLFSNTLSCVEVIFSDDAEKLMVFLRSLIYDGGSNFECLKERYPVEDGTTRGMFQDYNRVLLFTNGVSTMGKPLEPLECPMHIFSREEEANTQLLGNVAKASGGSYHLLDANTNINSVVNQLLSVINSNQLCYHHCTISGVDDNLRSYDLFTIDPFADEEFLEEFAPSASNLAVPPSGNFMVAGVLPSSWARKAFQLNLHYCLTGDTRKLITKSYTLEFPKVIIHLQPIGVEMAEDQLQRRDIVPKYWAARKIASILESDPASPRIEKLSKKFKLLTPNTSLLVLSALDQYVSYKVKPPRELEVLRLIYKAFIGEHIKEHERKKESKVLNLMPLWSRRLDWWKNHHLSLQGEYTPMRHAHLKDYYQEMKELQTAADNLWIKPDAGNAALFVEFDRAMEMDKERKARGDTASEPVLETQVQSLFASEQTATNMWLADVSKVDEKTASRIIPALVKPQLSETKEVPLPIPSKKMKLVRKSVSAVFIETAPQAPKTAGSTEKTPPEIKEEAKVMASALKKGDTLIIAGKEAKLLEMTTSKTGKHGHAKVYIRAVDEDGKKVESIVRSSEIISKAISAKAPSVVADLPLSIWEELPQKEDTFFQIIGIKNPNAVSTTSVTAKPTEIAEISPVSDMRGCIDTSTKRAAKIEVVQWKSTAVWMEELESAKKDRYGPVVDYYLARSHRDLFLTLQAYLTLRPKYSQILGFYFDVACLLFELAIGRGESLDLAYRVISTITELELENPHHIRIVARKLQEFEIYKQQALQLYSHVLSLRPEEPQSYRDLALALVSVFQESTRQHLRALKLLNKVIKGVWPDIKFLRFNQFEVVALMDVCNIVKKLNGMVGNARGKNANSPTSAYEQINTSDSYDNSHMHLALPVDSRLTGCLPAVDLRVVLQWSDMVDVELHVQDPNDEMCYSFHNATKIGGLLSADCTGHGPEEFVIKNAIPGTYKIYAKLFHTSQMNPSGSIVTCTITPFFGQDYALERNEKHISARLVKSKEIILLGTVRFY